MTPAHDTIETRHAEILVDLFAASTILTSRLPPHVAARLPEAARLRDAADLADLCRLDHTRMASFIEKLDARIGGWDGYQPFRMKDIEILAKAVGASRETERVTALLAGMDIPADRSPAPRTARLVAAAQLAVSLRRLQSEVPAFAGAAALVMRHALRKAGIKTPVVRAVMASDSETDIAGLLMLCVSITERIGQGLEPAVLLPAVKDLAATDLPDMRPLLEALRQGTPVPRGAVAERTGLPERTARRRIAALIETGWARSETVKGPLLPDVPPAVLAGLMRGVAWS